MKRWIWAGLIAGVGLQLVVVAGSRGGGRTQQPQELKIPKSIARIKDYEKVKAEAKAKKKPIVVVISAEGVKRANLEQDTQFALQHARSIGALIYVDQKEIKQLPQSVAPSAVEIQGDIPAMLFVDPESDEVLASVKCEKEHAAWERNLREAKKKLKGEDPAQKGKPGEHTPN